MVTGDRRGREHGVTETPAGCGRVPQIVARAEPVSYEIPWDVETPTFWSTADENLTVTVDLSGVYATVANARAAIAPDGDTSRASAASLTDPQLSDATSEAQAEVDSAIRARHMSPSTFVFSRGGES